MKNIHIALISALSLGAALPVAAIAAPAHKVETKKVVVKKTPAKKVSCRYVVKNHKKVKVCK
ncbi:hypothetical protein [Novosphingobium sp. 9]|uniref:hypothetical protein n=1 Tax=Novosphingobium sp. 9 TaxID=2025349 RepID=UPI0021B6C6CA|nr:hypothetical protein [Novosphingobium sp. 9]